MHDLCLAVIMVSICEMCILNFKKSKKKLKIKKKSVDALIVHVVRLVDLRLKVLYCLKKNTMGRCLLNKYHMLVGEK